MHQQHRKKFWIDSPLQLQMMGYVLLLVTASLLLLSLSTVRGIEAAASAQAHEFFFSLEWVRGAIRAPMILASCLAILASGVVTLLWSHRFAGPLRVLSSAMARLRDGNLSAPVRIRKTDTHQDLVSEFAQMQEHLRGMVEKDRHLAHAVAKNLTHLAEKLAVEHHAHKDLEAAASELQKIGAEYRL